MPEKAEVVVDVWGDFAMFTRPETKVERTTYYVPTPSACRGILNAIYSKPVEFYYEIVKIEVMKPIRTLVMKKNEVTCVVDVNKAMRDKSYHLDSDSNRTQRVSTYLRDVYYRIHANVVKRDDVQKHVNITSLVDQFNRRVKSGKCFYQPYFGSRECLCYFSDVNSEMQPIAMSKTLGIMLYDVFDITENAPLNTDKKNLNLCQHVSFFNAVMDNGVIKVPAFDSGELYMKKEGGTCV